MDIADLDKGYRKKDNQFGQPYLIILLHIAICNMVPDIGIEPMSPACKTGANPLS